MNPTKMVTPNHHHWAILIFIFSASYICIVTAINIDDKLDFGHRHSDATEFNRRHNLENNRFLPVKYTNTMVKNEESNKGFANIGVVCTNGGCNLTKPSNVSEENLGADVVVHIETRVNLNQNKSKVIVDETPDVPIVVGNKGYRLDQRGYTSPNYKSIYYLPNSHSQPVSTLNPPYSTRPRVHTMPNTSPFSHIYNPPQKNFRYETSNNNNYPTYGYAYNPSIKGNDFPNYLGSNMNINTNKMQPVTLGISRDSHVNYFDNSNDRNDRTAGVVVPYFDPSYHKHYYGEHPPPQYVHHPMKNSNSFNPVEFKMIKTTPWSPSVFYRFVPHIGDNMMGKCSCQNEHPVLGMKWYPTVNRKNINTDPGASIDDKLAPLN